MAVPAAASPNTVTGTTCNLSALGADDAGESNLTYTWSTTGTPPAAVSFSTNGSNAAKNTTATFTAAGNYSFQVTITDPSGLTATSTVNVTVNQTLTAITVSPPSANLNAGGTQQYTATAEDQFGAALATADVHLDDHRRHDHHRRPADCARHAGRQRDGYRRQRHGQRHRHVFRRQSAHGGRAGGRLAQPGDRHHLQPLRAGR